jgi:hypothetical protein
MKRAVPVFQRVDGEILELIASRVGGAINEHYRDCRSGSNDRCESADALKNVLFANHDLIHRSLLDLIDLRKGVV